MQRYLFIFILVYCVRLGAIETQTDGTSKESLPAVTWQRLAKHVGQSETKRQQALKKLKELPNLREILSSALETSDKYLALDVISALQMQNFTSELLLKVAQDEDGFIVLTLNSLLTVENKNSIIERYLEILKSKSRVKLAGATVVAMLEPLGRLGIQMSTDLLQNLLNSESYEVKGAAVHYLRYLILEYGDYKVIPFVPRILVMKPFQIRIQGLFLIEEIILKQRRRNTIKKEDVKLPCASEKNRLVILRCQRLIKKMEGLK